MRTKKTVKPENEVPDKPELSELKKLLKKKELQTNVLKKIIEQDKPNTK